MTGMTTCIKRL